MKPSHGHAAPRRILAGILAGMTLFSTWAAASFSGGRPVPEALSVSLLSSQLPRAAEKIPAAPSLLTALVTHESPLFAANYGRLASPAEPPLSEENREGTVIDPAAEGAPQTPAPSDNGVEARTIHPTNPAGYLVWKNVYLTNTTDYRPDLNALMQTRPAARFTGEMPQILILHTHGTEAYTLPPDQAVPDCVSARSENTDYNVVRVGDEMAAVFEEAGISVLHDRTLHDLKSYNDSYAHACTAIEHYLKKYPSIHFVLDVHRDAIEDKNGKSYKVLSEVDGKNAAQLSLVVGSDGSGLPHPGWRENLRLALLLQQHITESYPTLMRPMYLRNSRYNEHATAGSLLVEVGAAGNSLDEALCAARLFAGKMVEVLKTLQ